MKTLVDTTNKLSRYLLKDSEPVHIGGNYTSVGTNPVNQIWDLKSENTVLYEDISDAPSDWANGKYKYDGKTWTKNPDYEEPKSD
jgi:hypothetical protein